MTVQASLGALDRACRDQSEFRFGVPGIVWLDISRLSLLCFSASSSQITRKHMKSLSCGILTSRAPHASRSQPGVGGLGDATEQGRGGVPRIVRSDRARDSWASTSRWTG